MLRQNNGGPSVPSGPELQGHDVRVPAPTAAGPGSGWEATELDSEEAGSRELAPEPAGDWGAPQAAEAARASMPLTGARRGYRAAATFCFDGYQETFAAQVLNLSATGLGCRGPRGLQVGNTLRVAMPLPGDGAPQSFLCEVMWARAADRLPDGAAELYGMRFVELSPGQARELQEACQDEIRAGDANPVGVASAPKVRRWATAAQGLARRRLPVVLAAGGVAALVATGGLVALLAGEAANRAPTAPPHDGLELVSLPRPPAVPAPSLAAAAGGGSSPQSPGSPAAPDLDARERAARTGARLAALSQPSPSPAAPQPPSSPPGRRQAAARPHVHPALALQDDGRRVAFRLQANGPVGRHQSFWLDSPRRLVVDLHGRGSGHDVDLFEVHSPMVRRVRVGRHADKVRFVIETRGALAQRAVLKPQGTALTVELRRPS